MLNQRGHWFLSRLLAVQLHTWTTMHCSYIYSQTFQGWNWAGFPLLDIHTYFNFSLCHKGTMWVVPALTVNLCFFISSLHIVDEHVFLKLIKRREAASCFDCLLWLHDVSTQLMSRLCSFTSFHAMWKQWNTFTAITTHLRNGYLIVSYQTHTVSFLFLYDVCLYVRSSMVFTESGKKMLLFSADVATCFI